MPAIPVRARCSGMCAAHCHYARDLTDEQYRQLCLSAFENLPSNTQVTMADVDAILTWCLPAYDELRAL